MTRVRLRSTAGADGEDVFNGDRVHPNDLGQWRMAETLLSAQGLTIEPYRPRSEVAASAGLSPQTRKLGKYPFPKWDV